MLTKTFHFTWPGSVLPDFTEIELTSVTREVEGHRIRGTMETLPCGVPN